MAEVISPLVNSITGSYNELIKVLPGDLKLVPPLFFISATITLFGMFVWVLYKFLAEKSVLKLNLRKDNEYNDPKTVKSVHVFLYILEFMIISPIFIFIWFAVFSILIIVLAKDMDIGTAMLICAAFISSIRVCAYFKADLAREMAKLIPFTLLGVAILTPGFIDIGTNISRITQIPLFFNNAFYYFISIVILEVGLRLLYIPVLWSNSKKEE